jgi:DNA-directed RNA polymerase alpha subunit
MMNDHDLRAELRSVITKLEGILEALGPDPLSEPVLDLELSVRSANCLSNAGIGTVGDLIKWSEAELLRIPNFWRVSLREVKELLAKKGLRLAGSSAPWIELSPPWPKPPGS